MNTVYDHDDIVTTKDGKQHRVLWQAKRDSDGVQVELWCKSLQDKVKRRIKVRDIVARQHRESKMTEQV